ncbi:GT2 family glycosyltransferase [Arthrobacter sp. AG367]|uniref:glycosyltransferase family 2 protein n=1 Tax=Arthrobacter sp. AG367 TaxID=2572909 RepID=UPI0011A2350E|nr:GT2 family glycosyltransferase [Arthrobacter sp. AG367]
MAESPLLASKPSVAIIMAVHNRKEITLRCLHGIASQTFQISPENVIVVDDGSTDGTSDAIKELFPETHVIHGDGTLFWGRAMARAEAAATAKDVDFILWLNDDIEMQPTAIQHLVECSASVDFQSGVIVTGALSDPTTGATSYSGYRINRPTWGFLRLKRLDPHASRHQEIDTFNGNIVLVPRAHSLKLRGIDSRFTHHYGDLDFGLRAKKLGIRNILASGYVGTTSRNSDAGSFRDRKQTPSRRYRNLTGPKGFPPRERFRYFRRHGEPLWLLQWAGFYLIWISRIVVRR